MLMDDGVLYSRTVLGMDGLVWMLGAFLQQVVCACIQEACMQTMYLTAFVRY